MRKLLATVMALALSLAFQGTALAATTQILTAHHAGADFSVLNGNVTTEVFIDVGSQTLQTEPGNTVTSTSRLNILIRRCEAGSCRPPLWSAEGTVENPNFQVATNLDRATLQQAVVVSCTPGTGSCPKEMFTVTVDLTWTATSAPILTAGSSMGPDEGVIVADSSMRREAVAFGSVSYKGTNFAPNPDFTASIELTRVHIITL